MRFTLISFQFHFHRFVFISFPFRFSFRHFVAISLRLLIGTLCGCAFSELRSLLCLLPSTSLPLLGALAHAHSQGRSPHTQRAVPWITPSLPRPGLDPGPNLIKSLNRIEQLYKAPSASAPLPHPLRHQMRPIKAHIKQKITSASCRPIAIYISTHTHTVLHTFVYIVLW